MTRSEVAKLVRENAKLRTQLKTAVEYLRRRKWKFIGSSCPECRAHEDEGHIDTCPLGQLLKDCADL